MKKGSNNKTPIKTLFIVGPTGVGKTEVAIEVASILETEIISADSMQVYKGLDIGSAKPSKEEQEKAPHHMIDIVSPKENFNVSKYAKLARDQIKKLEKTGKIPIVCGGTGLYINSLLYDMDFAAAGVDVALRRKLEKEAEIKGKVFIHNKLVALSPEMASSIHPNRLKKVIRSIEIINANPNGLKHFEEAKKANGEIEPIIVLLNRDREELYSRINNRVDRLIKEGLVKEVRGLLLSGLNENDISYKGIGYKEIADYISGITGLDEAILLVKQSSRRYAKRQLTWFRRYAETMHEINLSEIETATATRQILEMVK
jgi:tRNA dimethylallyltransferase